MPLTPQESAFLDARSERVSLEARWLAMSEDERFRVLCWAGVRDVYARQLTCIDSLNAFRAERREAVERVMRDEAVRV